MNTPNRTTSALLLLSALNSHEMYPAAVVINGEERKRTPWQEGWNESLMTLTKTWKSFSQWLSSLSPIVQEMVVDLVQQHVLEMDVDEDTKNVVMSLNMNDTFGYASADSEHISEEHLPTISYLWRTYGADGLTAWAAHHRQQEPIAPRATPLYQQARKALSVRTMLGGRVP